MKVLHLLSDLAYNSAARQILMLGPRLAGKVELRVCALRVDGPWANELRCAGAKVECCGWTRKIDPRPLWRLQRLLCDFDPDRIHVWRLPALWALALAGRRYLARAIVSQPLHGIAPQAGLGKAARWLLQRVGRIVATGASLADRLGAVGVDPRKLATISPGMEIACAAANQYSERRDIVCVGALERRQGYEEALWAYDVLAFAHADVHLRLVGEGAHRQRLDALRAAKFFPARIHFHGQLPQVQPLLAKATVCWAPRRRCSGALTVLEAMAAGCPVIAADWPELRELVKDGETGLFAPSGDRPALVRHTQRLLLEPELRQTMAANARNHVQRHFNVDRWADEVQKLYAA